MKPYNENGDDDDDDDIRLFSEVWKSPGEQQWYWTTWNRGRIMDAYLEAHDLDHIEWVGPYKTEMEARQQLKKFETKYMAFVEENFPELIKDVPHIVN